eukprot:jgi/Chlat1/2838/Chrsp194S03001
MPTPPVRVLHSSEALVCVAWAVACVAAVGLSFRLCLGGRRRRLALLREFNEVWAARLALVVCAIALVVLQILRMSGLWVPGGKGAIAQIPTMGQVALCKVYAVAAQGAALPLFCLLSLFLLLRSLRSWPVHIERFPNLQVLVVSVLAAGPVVLPITLLVFHASFAFQTDACSNTLAHNFFDAYDKTDCTNVNTGTQSPPSCDQRQCAYCVYPLANTLILAVFVLSFLVVFNYTCSKLAQAIINKHLLGRLRTLQSVYSVCLPSAIGVMALSTIWNPLVWAFELLFLAYVVLVIILATVGVWILGIVPIYDATNVVASSIEVAKSPNARASLFPEKQPDESLKSISSSGGYLSNAEDGGLPFVKGQPMYSPQIIRTVGFAYHPSV